STARGSVDEAAFVPAATGGPGDDPLALPVLPPGAVLPLPNPICRGRPVRAPRCEQTHSGSVRFLTPASGFPLYNPTRKADWSHASRQLPSPRSGDSRGAALTRTAGSRRHSTHGTNPDRR